MKIQQVRETVTNQVIASLEEGNPPWTKPWNNDGSSTPLALMPRNGKTKRPYSGINWLILNLFNPFGTDEWFTKNQAIELTKLDKPIPYEEMKNGTNIIFYKDMFKENDKGETEKYPLMRSYTVWNRDQIPTLPPSKREKIDFNAQTEIEKMLSRLDLKGGVHVGGDQAFYMPSRDAICIPNDDAFENEFERESTKAHEGCHATGAKHRLNRKCRLERSKENYAYEELIAELGAAMVCGSIGMPLEKLQHQSYIETWLERLKSDTKYIFKASAEAAKAAQYLMGETNANTANQ